MKKHRGFTLLELMIVVAIVAILAAVALGAYTKQVRKSRRAEAKQALADFALREEKFRSNSATYTTTVATLLNGSTAPTLVYYSALVLATPSGTCSDGSTAASAGNSFQITATAKLDQLKDTGCTPLVLVSKCGQVAKTPAGCW